MGTRASYALNTLRILLVLLYAQYVVDGARMKQLPRLEEYGNCEDENTDNQIAYFNESSVLPQGKRAVGRGIVIVRKTVQKLTKAVAYINKCRERGDPHCENYQTWRFSEALCCSHMLLKNMIWTPLFDFNPNLNCPLHSGVYRVENATVDLEKLKMIRWPTDGYWKVKLMVDGDYEKFWCMYMELAFINVRV